MSSDNKLVAKAKSGDQRSVIALYQKYFPPIYRFCYYQTGNKGDAEDLTQEVFVAMIKSLKKYQGTGKFKNWLYTIAKRQIISWLRHKYNYKKTTLGDWIPDTPKWIDPDNQKIKTEFLKKIINTLPQKHQQVLKLRFFKNYSIKETATALKITISNVKVIQHRATKKLAKLDYTKKP